jgi:hypothetical protein
MRKSTNQSVFQLLLLIGLGTLSGCLTSQPEKPGSISNPKLASLTQQALSKEIASMNPTWAPGLRSNAGLVATSWLAQISEVVGKCRYGPDDTSKFNKIEYEIKLISGEVLAPVSGDMLCQYQKGFGKPLVIKLIFRNGAVVDAFTDGRELNEPVSYAQPWIKNCAEKIIRADWRRRPELYFNENKTKEQIRKEWEK